jgi:hypothetical protein
VIYTASAERSEWQHKNVTHALSLRDCGCQYNRNRKLQHLKTIQVQNQRRIKELLIRTDPSRTKEEIKGTSLNLEKSGSG